jgi:hypothetical protein
LRIGLRSEARLRGGIAPAPRRPRLAVAAIDYKNGIHRELDRSEAAGDEMVSALLPGLPIDLIRGCYAAAPGNEIAGGKFASPASSAALAANTFGPFLPGQPATATGGRGVGLAGVVGEPRGDAPVSLARRRASLSRRTG